MIELVQNHNTVVEEIEKTLATLQTHLNMAADRNIALTFAVATNKGAILVEEMCGIDLIGAVHITNLMEENDQ